MPGRWVAGRAGPGRRVAGPQGRAGPRPGGAAWHRQAVKELGTTHTPVFFCRLDASRVFFSGLFRAFCCMRRLKLFFGFCGVGGGRAEPYGLYGQVGEGGRLPTPPSLDWYQYQIRAQHPSPFYLFMTPPLAIPTQPQVCFLGGQTRPQNSAYQPKLAARLKLEVEIQFSYILQIFFILF